MAAPLATGDVVQVIIRQSFDSQAILNVLHYRADVPPSLTSNDSDQVLSALDSQLNSANQLTSDMIQLQVADVLWQYIQYQIVFPFRRPYFRSPSTLIGTNIGDPSPAGVSAVITKRSENAGRGRSGSFHLAGVPTNAYSASVIDSIYLEQMSDLGDRIAEEQAVLLPPVVDPIVFTPVLWSGPEDLQGALLIGCVSQPEVRYMTRRTVGRGI